MYKNLKVEGTIKAKSEGRKSFEVVFVAKGADGTILNINWSKKEPSRLKSNSLGEYRDKYLNLKVGIKSVLEEQYIYTH